MVKWSLDDIGVAMFVGSIIVGILMAFGLGVVIGWIFFK